MYKNIIANIIGRSWSVLSNFLFVPLYLRFLGIESYSIISLTLVIVGLMAVLDAGLTASLSREFALSTNNKQDKLNVLSTLESCYFIIAIIIVIVTISLSDVFAQKWLNLGELDPLEVGYYIRLMGVGVAFQFLSQFYMGGLLGLERQVVANMYQIGWGVVRNGLVIIPLIFVPSLEVFLIWQTVSTFIYVLLLRNEIFHSLSAQTSFFFYPKIDKKILRKIGRFAFGMLLISLVAGLNSQMDKLSISKMLPISVLGYYVLAVSLTNSLNVIVSPISVAFLPRLTALFSEKRKEEAFELYYRVFLLTSILIFSVAVNLLIYRKEVLWVWTGNVEVANASSIFIPYLIIGMTCLALLIVPYNIAISNAYTRLNNILGISSLCITIPGYWVMTQCYGGIGAAIVWSAVQLFVFPIYLFVIHKRFLPHVSTTLFLCRTVFCPLVIIGCIGYLLSFIFGSFSNRWLSLLWICFTVFFSFSVCALSLMDYRKLLMVLCLKNNK